VYFQEPVHYKVKFVPCGTLAFSKTDRVLEKAHLMFKMPRSGKDHRNAVFVAGFY